MKFGRKKAEKDYQTWPIWDNYRYTFAWIKRSEGRKVFGFCIADVVLQVAVPFVQMALPGAVCAFLTSGRRAEQILLLICGYVLLVQALSLLAGYVGERRQLELFLFRMDCDKEFYPKCLDVDAQFLESTLGQKKLKNACMNIYSGNDIGIEAFVNALLKAATNLGGLTVYAVLIGQNSLPLLAFLVLLTALVSACNYRYGKKGTGFFESGWKIMQNCLYLLKESIAAENGKDIRLYRMKKMFGDAFRRMTDQAVETKHREQTCYLRAEMVEKGAALLRDGVVYGYLIFQMMRGSLALPGFLLYAGIVAGFGSWMSGLVTSVQNIVKNNYLMDRYRDFMVSGVVDTEGKQAVLRPGKAHEIRLEHVCFRYEGQKEDVLHDINLTIKAGEKLALVGANGAGKTTLVKLISGLYRPTEGKVYLDGQDVSEILKEDYFKELSVVFQEVFAFSFPLEDNVSCRDTEHMDTEKMVESLKKADLWEKVSTLEKGSKTVMNKDLDENGVSLSGGELQKLMLARALYKDAAVVILDEPTAALDPLAESAMYERYYEMTRQKTAVFISHRLSSTRFCDRIILLENGQITETGNHEELMQKNGAYARMFELQAKYYKEKEKGEECYA